MRCARSCFFSVVLFLAVSGSAFSEDPHSIPPFDSSKTYSVSGSTLEAFRLGLIQLDEKLANSEAKSSGLEKTLETLQTSFEGYKTQTLRDEIVLGGMVVLSTGAAGYFAGHSWGWW